MGEVKNGVESVLEGFAAIPRLSRLSPERLCDFPARVCDFDRAADLTTGSAAFPFPGGSAAGSTRAAWALPRFRPDRGGVFLPFIMYSVFSLEFSDGKKKTRKHDIFFLKTY